jgi:hypothetical protein
MAGQWLLVAEGRVLDPAERQGRRWVPGALEGGRGGSYGQASSLPH